MDKKHSHPNLEPETNRSTQEQVKLTDITRGLYHAATSTTAMVANQYIHLLSQYFTQSSDGSYKAKTVEVEMPDQSKVKVPLISMVSPKGLMLDKVNFDFAVVADPSSLAQATTTLNEADLTRSSFKVEMATKGAKGNFWQKKRKQGIVDVSIEFKAIEPPEGLMRLMDKFASIVTPYNTATPSESYLRLLSPSYLHVADVLESDKELASIFSEFNALEYTADSLRQLGNELNEWEKHLLQLSVEIDQEKNRISEQFKNTYKYARIAFQDTEDYDKLQLGRSLSNVPREWTKQAVEFYDTLLADHTLSFQLSKLKNTEVDLNATGFQWQEEYDEIKKVAAKMKEYDELKVKSDFYKERKAWLRKFKEIGKILLKEHPEKLAKLFPDSEFLNK